MKPLTICTVLLLATLTIGCGKSQQQSDSLNLSGNWIVSTNGSSISTITANLVSIAPDKCYLPDGPYTDPGGGIALVVSVDGSSGCFLADNIGDGSISGTGQFYYPLHAVLIGLRAPPLDTVTVQMVVAEGTPPQYQNVLFDANGTLVNGTINGTWTCSADYASICGGVSGTFTGHRQ